MHVERHDEHSPPDCPDETWLRAIGERGWVAITHNSRIRYTPNERWAVMAHLVPLLVVVGKARYADLARGFVATLPRIEAFLDAHAPPFIAKVYRAPIEANPGVPASAGRAELWYPKP